MLSYVPLLGGVANQALGQIRDGLKALLTGGMLFEELGFRYIGPVDGHDLPRLRFWLSQVKRPKGTGAAPRAHRKGQGVPQASKDPVTYHTPPVFEKVGPDRSILLLETEWVPSVHGRFQCGHLPGHGRGEQGHRHHGRHGPGQQAGKDSRRISRTVSSIRESANRHAVALPPDWPRPAFGPSWRFIPLSSSVPSTSCSRKWPCRICP